MKLFHESKIYLLIEYIALMGIGYQMKVMAKVMIKLIKLIINENKIHIRES